MTLLICLITLIADCQPVKDSSQTKQVAAAFKPLIRAYQQRNERVDYTAKLPLLYESRDYKLMLADSAIALKTSQFVFMNPFGLDKYPLSYSVLYKNRLVSLFSPGQFTCRNTKSWLRDEKLEKALNGRRFDRFWLIGNALVARSGQTNWRYDAKKGWLLYGKKLPLTNGPKLFEDDTYLVYSTCNGEFGGRVYFFNKRTKLTRSTEATCAVWVLRVVDGYEVVSNSGHGIGSADIMLIRNPEQLPVDDKAPPSPLTDGNVVSLFSASGIQLFGGMIRNNVVHYIQNGPLTTLTTRSGNEFTVMHTLFNERLYTHGPVTTNYNGTYLINLDFYGEGGDREVACLLLDANTATLIDWHMKHRH